MLDDALQMVPDITWLEHSRYSDLPKNRVVQKQPESGIATARQRGKLLIKKKHGMCKYKMKECEETSLHNEANRGLGLGVLGQVGDAHPTARCLPHARWCDSLMELSVGLSSGVTEAVGGPCSCSWICSTCVL